MKVYKATDKDMRCRGFQFEQGETYEEDTAELCNKGFHAVEDPIDMLAYYAPGDGSRYFEAQLDGVSDKRSGDTKVVGKKISIGAEIGIPGIAKAHIEYVKSKCEKEKNKTGDRSANSATGYRSANSATGDRSANSATGDRSANSATGYGSANVSTGVGTTNSGGVATISVGWGPENRCKGSIDAYIVLSEWGDWDGEKYPLLAARMAKVDGETIKPDTWYALKDGEFVEVPE